MRTIRLVAAATALAAAVAATVAGCSPGGGGAGRGAGGVPAGALTMNQNGCGGTWHVAGPGWHTFELHDGNTVGGEVDLVDPATGGIYDEISSFAPQTTVPMRLDLGSGRYAFRCLFADTDPMTGPSVTVPGHAAGQRAILPVTYNDLIPLAKKYQAYVATGLRALAGQVATLDGDVRSGDLAAARRDWLPAHLRYETLGAAYGTFGKLDDEIDGRADALGVSSPKWTGFYRLEYGLWHGQSAAELRPVAGTLKSDVDTLRAAWPHREIALADLGLRAHEILENALQYQLTGHDDYGSGTTLATTLANVRGTLELLSLLRPLLAPRYPGLPAAYRWLDRLRSLLEKQRSPNGSWLPASALPASTRANVVSACDQALQELAPVASITEPRNT
ncbi:MAG: EfeM/EfeO family lipoprotein [Nocardiopsaceae bacterium]|nr:EfeM/EfeO family lipoprotein [Nocardiopsaceae bacterium]